MAAQRIAFTIALQTQSGDTAICDINAIDATILVDRTADRPARLDQSRRHQPVVNLSIERAEHPAAETRVEMGLPSKNLSRRQPGNRQVHPAVKVMGESKFFGIVARQGNHHGALRPITDGKPCHPFQLGREIGPETLTVPRKWQQSFFGRLSFDLRRQHAGGGPTGLAATDARLEKGDSRAQLTKTPRDRQPDHAAADNSDPQASPIRFGTIIHEAPRLPSLV